MKIFVGIDQTGSAKSSGKKAAPLSAAVLLTHGKTVTLRCALIDSLNPGGVERLLQGRSLSQCFILADSVLWPIGGRGDLGLWRGFQEANRFQYQGRDFGLHVGENFFKNLLDRIESKNRLEKPTRACERLAGANSVFKSRPFQRNIQTGTFRIWKDLGAQPRWLNTWPFTLSPDPKLGWLAEGYPSLYWKQILKQTHRRSESLLDALRTLVPSLNKDLKRDKLLLSDPNFADAAVLAVSAYQIYQKQKWKLPATISKEILQSEGWIYGL
jgi:hypothetical protein